MKINLSEYLTEKQFKAEGYKFLRNGHPDFVFYKEDSSNQITDVLFCEVKRDYSVLSKDQEVYRKILEFIGAKYILLRKKNIPAFADFTKLYKRKILTRAKETKVITLRDVSELGVPYPDSAVLLDELVKENLLKVNFRRDSFNSEWSLNLKTKVEASKPKKAERPKSQKSKEKAK